MSHTRRPGRLQKFSFLGIVGTKVRGENGRRESMQMWKKAGILAAGIAIMLAVWLGLWMTAAVFWGKTISMGIFVVGFFSFPMAVRLWIGAVFRKKEKEDAAG
jgi:hypothetical protein